MQRIPGRIPGPAEQLEGVGAAYPGQQPQPLVTRAAAAKHVTPHGWGLIAADVIVMASLAQIAGRYFLQLIGAGSAGTAWVTVAGVAFIALLTGVCYRGIEVSARLQQVLLVIEVGALAVFAVVALVKAGTGHALPGAAHPSAAWLNPWTGSFGSLSNSFLLAVFIYWGWDCALSVNEETKDSARTPGRAAVMAMSAHGAIPRAFARMHPRFRTPTVATVAMGVLSAVFYVLLTAVSRNVLADSAASVGLLIAFYYGLTAFACVWYFRRSLLRSGRDLVTKGVLPLAGGLTLLGAFVLSIKSYWPAASSYSSFAGVGGIFLIGAGSLVIGVIVMFVTARFQRKYFAHGIASDGD
jgi:amino acid transporter